MIKGSYIIIVKYQSPLVSPEGQVPKEVQVCEYYLYFILTLGLFGNSLNGKGSMSVKELIFDVRLWSRIL